MINAKKAKNATLKIWEEFIEEKINSAINKHQTTTDGIMYLPESIRKDLISRGFNIKSPYENYYYIDWENADD